MDPLVPSARGDAAHPPVVDLGSLWLTLERDCVSYLKGLEGTLERLGHGELPRPIAEELRTLVASVAALRTELGQYGEVVHLQLGHVPEVTPTDPIEVAEAVVRALAPRAAEQGVELRVLLDGGPWPILLAPRSLVVESLAGLVSEALEGLQGGAIDIEVAAVEGGADLELRVRGGAPRRRAAPRRGRRALAAALLDLRLWRSGAVRRDGEGLRALGLSLPRAETVSLPAPVGAIGLLARDADSARATAGLARAAGFRVCALEHPADWIQRLGDGLECLLVDEERFDEAQHTFAELAEIGCTPPLTVYLARWPGVLDAAQMARLRAAAWLARPLSRAAIRDAVGYARGASVGGPVALDRAPLPAAQVRPLRRALLAMDHLLEQAELAAHLLAAGWDVVQADTAEQLESRAKAGPVDVLVYTSALPGLTLESMGRLLEHAQKLWPTLRVARADAAAGSWPEHTSLARMDGAQRARLLIELPPLTPEPSMDHDPNAVLDPKVIANLRELDEPGAPSLLEELVAIFLEDAPKRVEALESALAAKDANALERVAHAFKSSCGNLGATELFELCHKIEQHGRAGQLDGTASLVARSRQVLKEVKAALHAELRGS